MHINANTQPQQYHIHAWRARARRLKTLAFLILISRRASSFRCRRPKGKSIETEERAAYLCVRALFALVYSHKRFRFIDMLMRRRRARAHISAIRADSDPFPIRGAHGVPENVFGKSKNASREMTKLFRNVNGTNRRFAITDSLNI